MLHHNQFKNYLSVIIPVYNEEESIKPLFNSIKKHLSSYNYEIIFVDDFSTDNTRQNILGLDAHNVVLIEMRKNFGQSLALSAGFDYASGEYVVTMDGDLQNDPSDIPKMLNILKDEDWDIVTGIRKKRKDSILKTLPSKIANFIVRYTTKLDLKDQGCALKVFRKEIIKELNLYGEMHRFINVQAYLNGAKIKQIPVNHHPRKYGKSKYGLGRTFKVINDLLLLLFQRKYFNKPIHLFGSIGIFFFLIGFIINIYLLILKILGEDIWGRPIIIVGVMLLLLGIQFFTIGIFSDLLMKTYFESQDKKPYTLRKITKVERKKYEEKTSVGA